jgi:hypothetical protein
LRFFQERILLDRSPEACHERVLGFVHAIQLPLTDGARIQMVGHSLGVVIRQSSNQILPNLAATRTVLGWHRIGSK